MDTPHRAKDLLEFQDVFGGLAHKIYTPLCLCLPLGEPTSRSQIIDILTKGLEKLTKSFPWLASGVINEEVAEDSSGSPKIISLGKTCRLILKDLTHDPTVPLMATLRRAEFPSSMLDGTVLTPLTGPPASYGESGEYPVFFVQANFIKGGLLLNLAGEHSVMDGQGIGEVIRMFSKACHNESFTDEELLQGNRSRRNIIPLLDQATYKPGSELDHLLIKPRATSSSVSSSTPLKCTWEYFHFSSSSLSKLKALALSSSSTSEIPTASYITTNDAVSAFIWQSVSRVRSSHLPSETTSTFARAVDLRSSLSVPSTYLGNMSNHTYTTLPLSSIPSTLPLAHSPQCSG
jgi:trichothecene 3-O-acetyltransferase